MALTFQKRFLRVKFADTAGDTTTRRYQIDTAAVDPAAAAAAMIASLQNVTDAEIMSYSIDDVYEEDAVVFPAGDINVENTLLMTGQILDEPTKSGTLSIPAPKPGTAGVFAADIGPNANIMDVADAAIVSLVTHFITGDFLLSDGEQWENNTIFGRRVHRKSNRTSSIRRG